MSLLSNIQQQFSELAPNNTANKLTASSINGFQKAVTSGGANFEEALKLAMSANGVALPASMTDAIENTSALLDKGGLLASAVETPSIKNSLEEVFSELNTGIATSFMAALSGADGVTAAAKTTENKSDEEAETLTTADGDETDADSALIADAQTVLEEATPKSPSFLDSTLSSIEDLFLGDDEEEDQTEATA